MPGKRAIDLSARQRELLVRGLIEWGGPTRPTDQLAQAMGFGDVKKLHEEADRIRRELERDEQLAGADYARALIATEIVFASNYYGSGVEWPTTTGWSDDETLKVLREVQRELVGVRL
jgi:hypothetical protein